MCYKCIYVCVQVCVCVSLYLPPTPPPHPTPPVRWACLWSWTRTSTPALPRVAYPPGRHRTHPAAVAPVAMLQPQASTTSAEAVRAWCSWYDKCSGMVPHQVCVGPSPVSRYRSVSSVCLRVHAH